MSTVLPAVGLPAPGAAALARDDAAYQPAFDWLRGALAVGVMLSHAGLFSWAHAGGFAVDVFFVLSGWLIGGLLLNTPRAELPRFYFNRAVRIWVPYYLAFGLLVAASLLRDSPDAKWFEFIAYKATMVWNLFGTQQLAHAVQDMPLQGTGNHFWSVNAEEQFYLLSPLLLVLAGRAGRSIALWAVLAVAGIASGLYPGIVLGVLAAVIRHKFGNVHLQPVVRLCLAAVGITAAAMLALGERYETYAPVLGLCIVLLLAAPGTPTRIGTIVGGMSYPLYLNHWIGVFVVHGIAKRMGIADAGLVVVVSSVLNIAFAVWLYTMVDARLLRQRRRWYTPARGKALLAAAYSMILLGLAIGFALR
jgi:peptidoglycan/LPS O-acetylase OafA/YrhL